MGKQCLLFVDDLSMPQKEKYGAQPPIELLRQLLDHLHWYDLKDTSKLELVDIVRKQIKSNSQANPRFQLFFGAMLPAGGGANSITSRFLRHLQIFGIETFEEATLTKIYSAIMDWHLAKGFEEPVKRLGKVNPIKLDSLLFPFLQGVVAASIQVYLKSIETFLPIPAKSHYTFNLRDLSRVIRGILLSPSTAITDPSKFIRLFIHETYRSFQDRLVEEDDKYDRLNELV